MNNDDILQFWQKRKSQLKISPGFSDRVMNQVFEYERRRSKAAFDVYRLIEFVSSNPAATAAAVALGALAGITRLVIVILSFLAF